MNTITVKYSGGLGNVLFQIAAVIAYSNKFDRTFIFSKYNALSNLDICSVENMGIDCAEYEKSLQDVLEGSGDELFTDTTPHLRLVGFFQDYRLFDKYRPQILTIIGIPIIRKSVEPIMQMSGFSNRGIFQDSPSENVTISLHIRQGDYEDLRCYFILLDEYYYKRALLTIANQLPFAKIKVVCFYESKTTSSSKRIIGELEKDNDIRRYPIEFHHFNDILEHTFSDIEEMAIMSHCSHHIIANSTYSWWSAYINPRKNKIVCYPDEYFNHQLYYLECNGLKVDGWTQVESWNHDKYRCDCRVTPVNHYSKIHKENSR